VKGYQVRGEGLCFRPGAQKSQYKLWRTTFDNSFALNFEMGVGTGAGVEGGTHARRGGGSEAQQRRLTGRHRTEQQYRMVDK
jgi:hypothetical protein